MVQQLKMDVSVEVTGQIQRILFSSPENGYCAISVLTEDQQSLNCTGILPEAREGLEVRLTGEWRSHPKYGNQLNFATYDVPDPSSEEAMVAYLATLKGCGPQIAQHIWDTFGVDSIRIMEQSPDKLLSVPGIGTKTLPRIIETFNETRALRNLIGFLGKLGVSANAATKIFRRYEDAAIATIKEDPYVLADQVKGFGFKKADDVARKLGVPMDSFYRIKAAIVYTLNEADNKGGHCYLPIGKLATAVGEMLLLPEFRPQISQIKETIEQLVDEGTLASAEDDDGQDTIWLLTNWMTEQMLAKHVQRLCGKIENPSALRYNPDELLSEQTLGAVNESEEDDFGRWVADLDRSGYTTRTVDQFIEDFGEENHPLDKSQAKAVHMAYRQGFSVLTGGPGTGKSSTSKAIIQMWALQGKEVVLAAPSGKAANRLKEATGYKAKTIHRLLEWRDGKFERNSSNMLDGDAFLIDEVSMVNQRLFKALLDAIPAYAVVMIVGDTDQLPAIGAGKVLADIIDSGMVPVTRLTKIHRQSENSMIAMHCRSVREGVIPCFERMNKEDIPRQDCLFLQVARENIIKAIQWLIETRLPQFGYDPSQIQILSPTKVGDYGCIAINALAQDIWNPLLPTTDEVRGIRVGDRIIQLRNNYNQHIFNGDLGMVYHIDHEEGEVSSLFVGDKDKHIAHDFRDLDDIALAYALTVHKSQGSEFPVVIIPITTSQFMMLHRNLLYTAMSRGKQLVILVGEPKAIAIAVRTVNSDKRNTMLEKRLKGKVDDRGKAQLSLVE